MYNSSTGIIVSLILVMIDDSTGTVIWPITVPVIFRSVVIYLLVYGNLADYRTGNDTKCHDHITGRVILPTTVLIIF
jgi:hypothetical protein